LWLDEKVLAEFSKKYGNDGLLLFDAIDDDSVEDGKRELPFKKKLDILSQMFVHPATHMAYAATWFILCVAGFTMTYLRFRKAPRRMMNRVKSKE